MAFLRVAEFDAPADLPDDAAATWKDVVSASLIQSGCTRASLARSGDRLVVVSEWESEDRYRTWIGSAEWAEAAATLAAKFGMSGGAQPTRLFEGAIEAAVS